MEIDIRAEQKDDITTIRFSERDVIEHLGEGFIKISDENCSDEMEVYCKDIDNLIKALQKAKELWG